MILIHKTKEPKGWTVHRLTPGADYEANDDLRNSLLSDQGFICGYCMRRIPIKDNGTDETSRIEHIMPREHLTRKERMEFSNMIICCPGAIAGVAEKKTHCDRRKGERYVSFTPFDPQFIDSLSYHNDGTIVSSNEVWDKEINDILNLNADLLKMNRKEVKKSIIKTLGNRKWSKAEISALRKKFEAKDSKGQLIEYCGVAMWYLSKKIKIES